MLSHYIYINVTIYGKLFESFATTLNNSQINFESLQREYFVQSLHCFLYIHDILQHITNAYISSWKQPSYILPKSRINPFRLIILHNQAQRKTYLQSNPL